jgi:outer membrane receptor for ferrienterochelin and colicin
MPSRILIAFLFFLAMPLNVPAQELDSLLNLKAYTEESDLQKALNRDVTVSTLKLSSRESPGIVSVISREEIANSGGRDLTDVLRLVPGFDIMQDLQFVQGLSLRGNWANEGKILVLMDGVPFNDLLYQSVAVGNRFPIDAIERIEIIRGPGSAIYGGSAEYGVINLITRAAESLNGVAVYGTAGLHAGARGRLNGGLMASRKSEDLSWDLSLFQGKGIVSDREFFDQSLADSTHADPLNINAGLRYKGLSFRTMFDRFETGDIVSDVSFQSFFAGIKYEIAVSSRFKITPNFQYLSQIPWQYDYNFDDEVNPDPDFKYKATRALAQVDANYNVSRKVNFSFGGLYFQDKSNDLVEEVDLLTLNNFALYSQALLKHRLFNATVGFRFEKNNRYKGAFVPRVGLTKKIENLHFKLLYSKSFRSPSLQNVQLDTTGASPEKSDVFEFEIGYQFTPEMLLAVNAFSISTRDIIIYGSQGEGDEFKEWYENYEKSGSTGVEVVYSIRKKRWYSNVTYSFSRAMNDNSVEKYVVQQTSKQYVGIPAQKATWTINYRLFDGLDVNSTLIFVGKRYAYVDFDDEGMPLSGKLHPYSLINAFVSYDPKLLKGLSLGAGVYDLLNERPAIPQAYNGEAGAYLPIPGRSREFVVKMSYQFNFSR